MGTTGNEKKMDRKMMFIILVWVTAATLGGCVISLNISKYNKNSDQKVEQSATAVQENDSTNFNFKGYGTEK